MFTDLLVNVFDIAFDTFINVIEMVSTSQAHVFFAYEASLCGKIEEVKIFLRISQLGQEFSAEYRRKEKKKKKDLNIIMYRFRRSGGILRILLRYKGCSYSAKSSSCRFFPYKDTSRSVALALYCQQANN